MKNDNIDSSSFIFVLCHTKTLFILSVTSFVFGFVFIGANNGFCCARGRLVFLSFRFFFFFVFVSLVLLHCSRTSSAIFVSNSLTSPVFPRFCALFIIIIKCFFFFWFWESAHRFSQLNDIFRVMCKVFWR